MLVFMLCKLCCKTLYTIDGVFIDHNRIIVIDCFRDLCPLQEPTHQFVEKIENLIRKQ